MKDLEELLVRSSHKEPRKLLRDDFTTSVLSRLKQQPPKRLWWGCYSEYSIYGLPRSVATLLTVVALLLLGGTTYAIIALNWPDTSATLNWDKVLNSGNHLVAINTKNCEVAQSLGGT